LFVVLIGVAVLFGRLAVVQQDVVGAASDAARAASVRATPADARTDGLAAAGAALGGGGVECRELSVDVDTAQLHPGGEVHVAVICTVSFADVLGFVVPGNRTVRSESVVVVDRYRSGETP
jgi:hypothetical protein